MALNQQLLKAIPFCQINLKLLMNKSTLNLNQVSYSHAHLVEQETLRILKMKASKCLFSDKEFSHSHL